MSLEQPLIGIVGDLTMTNTSPVIGFEYDSVRNDYAQAIYSGGGIPIYLPVINDPTLIAIWVTLCDGLLVPGGKDIHPLAYDEDPLPLLKETIPAVDAFQIHVIKKAYELNKPILAICRGHQILNVALGGTLFQDISYATMRPIQHEQTTQLHEVTHKLTISPHTMLHELFGPQLLVNSAHHQALHEISPHFIVAAKASDDIIEAIEYPHHPFMVGVQWHPETMLRGPHSMLPLFKAFINAARG